MPTAEAPNRPGSHLKRVFPRPSPIGVVLLCGFGVIFGLWLVSAYELARRVAETERQSVAITNRFTAGEELLFTVRAHVLLSSVYVRDAALDTRPDAATFYRDQLQTARADIDRALQRYRPEVNSSIEQEHWTRFETELQEYWVSLTPVLLGQVSPAGVHAFLRDHVVPKREIITRISEDIRILNQDSVREQQADVGNLHEALRRRIWWTSGLAVALGLVMAVIAAGYASRLEWQIRQQHVQERQHKRDLQRLSSELVHAQENERRTIGRDLHDEIGQALMTVKLDLGAVERSGQVSGSASQALADARSTTDEAIQSVRHLSQLLHPAMLDEFGLAVTLDAHVRSFSQRTGISAELVQDGMNTRIAPDLEICVYRVVQEALTNVAKHAQARSCRVFLHRLSHSLLVTVEDDGKGMPSTERRSADNEPPGIGLVGVRERVTRLGGRVEVESGAAKGTRLTIELPMSAATPAPEASSAEAASPMVAVERPR
jgi:signal transduction histidine kinase